MTTETGPKDNIFSAIGMAILAAGTLVWAFADLKELIDLG